MDNLYLYLYRYEITSGARESDVEKIKKYTQMIQDCQVEAEMLRQRFKSLTDEGTRYQKDNARIWDDLQKARLVCEHV
jgi:hypothetical protein